MLNGLISVLGTALPVPESDLWLLAASVALLIAIILIFLRRSGDDEDFEYASVSLAKRASEERADRVARYVDNGRMPELPALSYAVGLDPHETHEAILTAIVSYQHLGQDLPAADEFIEPPPGLDDFVADANPSDGSSKLSTKSTPSSRQVFGWPNIQGQLVRLRHELDGTIIDDINVSLLLARVVDAAILADEYFVRRHGAEPGTTTPFFNRIYLETPSRAAAALIRMRGLLPARVVIETPYRSLFRKIVYRSAGKRDKLTNDTKKHFGIAIEFRDPVKGRVHSLITPDGHKRTLCRAVKSRYAGVVQGSVAIRTGDPAPPLPIRLQMAPAGIFDPNCKSAQPHKTQGPIDQSPNILIIWHPPDEVWNRRLFKDDRSKFCLAKDGGCPFGKLSPEVATLRLDDDASSRKQPLPLRLRQDWYRTLDPISEVGIWWDERVRRAIRFPAKLHRRRMTGRRYFKDKYDVAGALVFGGRDTSLVEGIVLASTGPAAMPHLIVEAANLKAYLLGVWMHAAEHTIAEHTPPDHPRLGHSLTDATSAAALGAA